MKTQILIDSQITECVTNYEMNEMARKFANGASQAHMFTTMGTFFKEDWSDFLTLEASVVGEKMTITLAITNDELSEYIDSLLEYTNNSVATEYMRYMYKKHFFAFLHIFKHHKTNIDEFNGLFTELAKLVILPKSSEVDYLTIYSKIGKEIYNTLGLDNTNVKIELGYLFADMLEARYNMAGKGNYDNWIARQSK